MELLNGWYFEIETNGIVLFDNNFAKLINQINCSPKLKSSGNLDNRHNNEVINQFIELHKNNNTKLSFKFVISDNSIEADLNEIEEWMRDNNKTIRGL